MKIHELAEEMGVSAVELISKCQSEGVGNVTTALSSVNEAEAGRIRELVAETSASTSRRIRVYNIAKDFEGLSSTELVNMCKEADGFDNITHYMQEVTEARAEEIKALAISQLESETEDDPEVRKPVYEITREIVEETGDKRIINKDVLMICGLQGLDQITHHAQKVSGDMAERLKADVREYYEQNIKDKEAGLKRLRESKPEEPEEMVAIYKIASSLDLDVNGKEVVDICQRAGMDNIKHHAQKVSGEEAGSIKDMVQDRYAAYRSESEEGEEVEEPAISDDRLKNLLSWGGEMVQDGMYEDAVRVLNQAIETDFTNQRAWALKAVALSCMAVERGEQAASSIDYVATMSVVIEEARFAAGCAKKVASDKTGQWSELEDVLERLEQQI